ncbi:MAG: periplasmic divalent cation tolerance protein [Idiomarinaceae bacterium HL-53]|nr:MAG: periplasmic divalent cation tolerance protein [Idiomarinaceae bacterium HL-53]CUS48211.1 divalent cation tolerance protein [Idiomarinaceae bacterium HL-53]
MKPLMVLCSAPTSELAQEIASGLIKERLAACVQILPQMQSFYHWQGKVESASEYLLLIKTNTSQYSTVESYIQITHEYQVPEIIAIDISHGLPQYLTWLNGEVSV